MTAELRAPGGGSGVPDGGTTGQVLTKESNTDGDADWEDPAGGSGVPPGGTTGQVLRKDSNADGDATFGTITLAVISDAGTAASHPATDFDASGAAAAAQAASQPLDSDLTAIALLSTTSYGRALLELANAAAGRTAFGLGTAATANTGDFDAAGAAAVAQAASQPVDSDLTAIAALTTTSYGRSLLTAADATALRVLAALVIGTDVEAHDTDLTTIAGLTPSNDDVLQRKAGAWTNRTPAQLKSDLAITAADTGAQPLDSDLTAIAALATTSFGRGLLTLADAAAGRTALGLGTAALSAATDFQPIDSDLTAIAALATTSYGRSLLTLANQAALVAALGNIPEAQVTNLVSDLAAKAPIASPTFTGIVTLPGDGAGALEAVTVQQLNAALAGLDAKPEVAYAATSALPSNTYSNGTAGVGATLTGTANGPLIVDGVTILIGQVGERVLVAAESDSSHNGWYAITQQGVLAVSPYILTRAVESNQAAEIGPGYLTSVVAPSGDVAGANNGKVFVSLAPTPFVVGTSLITFSQVGSTYSAGTGLGLTGTTFAINDIELLALAGLTSAADRIPYFTGSGTAALATATSYGRALLALADLAALRAVLAPSGTPGATTFLRGDGNWAVPAVASDPLLQIVYRQLFK